VTFTQTIDVGNFSKWLLVIVREWVKELYQYSIKKS